MRLCLKDTRTQIIHEQALQFRSIPTVAFWWHKLPPQPSEQRPRFLCTSPHSLVACHALSVTPGTPLNTHYSTQLIQNYKPKNTRGLSHPVLLWVTVSEVVQLGPPHPALVQHLDALDGGRVPAPPHFP